MGLYFTPKVVGKNLGKAIFQMMLREARVSHAVKIFAYVPRDTTCFRVLFRNLDVRALRRAGA